MYRTHIWLYEPGFFGDEGPVITNVASRNLIDLMFECKSAIMSAPYSFLFCSKIIYHFFGFNETALRFTAYISGILTMFLSPFLCKKVFKREEIALIFLPILVFNGELCYYSQQFKQYSTDVFFSTLILYLFFSFKDKINTKKTAFLTGLFFGITGFLSFPCIFLVSGMSLFFIYRFLKNKQYKEIFLLIAPFISIFVLECIMTFYKTYNSGIMSGWDLVLNILSSFESFNQYLHFVFNSYLDSNLILTLFTIGIIYIILKERYLLIILILPILLNSISGFLNLYPCNMSRVVLYTIPLIMIICLKTFDFFSADFIMKKPILKYLSSLLLIGLSIYLIKLFMPLNTLPQTEINGQKYYYYRSNAREYVQKLNKTDVKPTDFIYVDRQGEGIFTVYDKDSKYQKNVIYQSVPNFYDINDTTNDNWEEKIKNINDIPKDSFIYFYNTLIYNDATDTDLIQEWSKNNKQIISRETDDIGEFLYVKKIK